MALPERLVAIAATFDGAHIAGGSESGRIYLWEACSGEIKSELLFILNILFADATGVTHTILLHACKTIVP